MMLRYGIRYWAFWILGNTFPKVAATCIWYWKPWLNTTIFRIAKRTHHCHSTKFTCYLIGFSTIKTFIELIQTFQTFYETLKRKLISFKHQNLAVCQFSNIIKNRGQAGRPRVPMQEETLLYFRDIGCSWKEIAELLLVSRWTIVRRVREYDIENQTGFSSNTRWFG